MAERAHETADDPGEDPTPHTTLDELAAEPERVARAADAAPVRIERPGAPPLVLVSAATFDRLANPEPRARYAHEWTERERELLRSQPIPDEAAEHDDEGGFLAPG